MKRFLLVCVLGLTPLVISGCQSAYYSAMEKVGVHKRDILVDRVEDTRDAQDEAQEQFLNALDQFRSVVSFEGGELEAAYSKLQKEYDRSEAAAEAVREHISKVEHVAQALFDEWEEELGQYSSQNLRAESARALAETKTRYKQLRASLKRAESRMEPVLSALLDNTLYLKHNLNARAIGSLKGEFAGIKADIDRLVADMQRSIQQSDQFIKDMKQ